MNETKKADVVKIQTPDIVEQCIDVLEKQTTESLNILHDARIALEEFVFGVVYASCPHEVQKKADQMLVGLLHSIHRVELSLYAANGCASDLRHLHERANGKKATDAST